MASKTRRYDFVLFGNPGGQKNSRITLMATRLSKNPREIPVKYQRQKITADPWLSVPALRQVWLCHL
jgi:hypothetical protein